MTRSIRIDGCFGCEHRIEDDVLTSARMLPSPTTARHSMSTPHYPSLVIEASTAAGSVALLRAGAVVQSQVVAMGASRDDALFPAIIAVLAAADMVPADLKAIVCGAGPGSFTSLRIAAALAKGLAHAAGCPLYSVPSLLLAAATHEVPGQYLVHADALRDERFALRVVIHDDGSTRADGPMTRIAISELDTEASGRRLLVLGEPPGVQDDRTVVAPRASAILQVDDWWTHGPVSLASWEPVYGRLAEAQVQWEVAHGRALPAQ